jgi:hypothetical protein
MKTNYEWTVPIFIVLAIFSIWLALTYLPLTSLGITIDTDSLWLFLPWIVAFAVGLFVLKELATRRR